MKQFLMAHYASCISIFNNLWRPRINWKTKKKIVYPSVYWSMPINGYLYFTWHPIGQCLLCTIHEELIFEVFGFLLACQRDLNEVIEEFVFHLPFREKGCFFWLAGMCVIVGSLEWEECLEAWKGSKCCVVPC